MTNYEKIKTMTVEDMAKVIDDFHCLNSCDFCVFADNCPNTNCTVGIKLWLESEVVDNESH